MFCAHTRPRYQVSVYRTISPLFCLPGSAYYYMHAVVELEKRQRGEHPALILKMENSPCPFCLPKAGPALFKIPNYLKVQYNFIFLVERHTFN